MPTSKSTSGFVYLWFDRKHRRFYVGCHWGDEDDGYICSSTWMNNAYKRRPNDFKRRILSRNITCKKDLLTEEYRWLSMIKLGELGIRYYNLLNNQFNHWSYDEQARARIGQKISAANTGRVFGPCSPEKRAKISATKKAKQRKWTDDHKQKISATKRGPYVDSPRAFASAASASFHASR